jgi:hypothetical protein
MAVGGKLEGQQELRSGWRFLKLIPTLISMAPILGCFFLLLESAFLVWVFLLLCSTSPASQQKCTPDELRSIDVVAKISGKTVCAGIRSILRGTFEARTIQIRALPEGGLSL